MQSTFETQCGACHGHSTVVLELDPGESRSWDHPGVPVHWYAVSLRRGCTCNDVRDRDLEAVAEDTANRLSVTVW